MRNTWPPCGEGRWNPSQTYATKFISPSFGFAMGRNFWFNWAITVAADLVPSGLVMYYWFPAVPSWVWAGEFLGVCGAAANMNAVILTSILSADNSGLYAASRMLPSMALVRQAPRCSATRPATGCRSTP